MISAFKQQSLLHFLTIGLILTVLYSFAVKHLTGTEKDSALGQTSKGNIDKTVSLSRENILNFLQYREKAFDVLQASQALDEMSPRRRQHLIDDYVLEEVLVREAKAMQLQQNDYVIRSRLVQKMEYLTEGFIAQTLEPTDEDLQEFFEENSTDYQQQANASFTHVYFPHERAKEANQSLAQLNKNEVSAENLGQGFIYQKYYVKRPIDLITSHFGQAFTDTLFSLDSAPIEAPTEHVGQSQDLTVTHASKIWQGPIPSKHGVHLVLLTELNSAKTPSFVELKPQLLKDWRIATTKQQTKVLLDELIAQYKIVDDQWRDTLASTGAQQVSGAMQ